MTGLASLTSEAALTPVPVPTPKCRDIARVSDNFIPKETYCIAQ